MGADGEEMTSSRGTHKKSSRGRDGEDGERKTVHGETDREGITLNHSWKIEEDKCCFHQSFPSLMCLLFMWPQRNHKERKMTHRVLTAALS